MTDLIIRDTTKSVVAVIDARAKEASMSRQAFLHQHITQEFGPDHSLGATAQIAHRLQFAFKEINGATFGSYNANPVSVSTLAERLGYKAPITLEGYLHGDSPLPFQEADKLCSLLGLNRQWLLNCQHTPYAQTAKYGRDTHACLRDLINDRIRTAEGLRYTDFYFVQSRAEQAFATVYGSSVETPYRYDLLLRDLPMGKFVGGTGERQTYELAMLCAAFDKQRNWTNHPIRGYGRIIDATEFDAYLSGRRHAGFLSSTTNNHQPWHEDLGDLDFHGTDYSQAFAEAKKVFRDYAAMHGITSNAQVQDELKKLMEERL